MGKLHIVFRIAIIFVSLFLVSPMSVKAQVVLNELFPNPSGDSREGSEFIELYNNSDSEIDVSNYILEETKTYIIKDRKIPARGFLYLTRSETGLALNNNGDKVTLKDSGANIIDTFEYKETIEDKSWSRIPDGTGSFVNNTEPSRGSKNNPGPTEKPAPTNMPTITFPPEADKITPIDKNYLTEEFDEDDQVEEKVLSKNKTINQGVTDKTSSNRDRVSSEVANSKVSYIYLVFVVAGFLLLVASVFMYYKSRNEK